MWQEILTSVLTSGLITGIFVLILNKAIENKFDMKLEAYKDKLKAESDKELLQLTKDLELKASERNIKLTSIFEKQAETILTIYKKLRTFKTAMKAFTDNKMEASNERRTIMSNLADKWRDLTFYIDENKILIESETVEKLINLENLHGQLFGEHLVLGGQIGDAFTEAEIAERLARKNEIKEINKQVDEVKKKLEADFREILGISPKKAVGEPK